MINKNYRSFLYTINSIKLVMIYFLCSSLNSCFLPLLVERRQLMARVVHFDISAENIERVIQFYESIFGWKFTN